MPNLVLDLRDGEVMIINGAPIRFRTRSRIELTAKARFLADPTKYATALPAGVR